VAAGLDAPPQLFQIGEHFDQDDDREDDAHIEPRQGRLFESERPDNLPAVQDSAVTIDRFLLSANFMVRVANAERSLMRTSAAIGEGHTKRQKGQ
jgi:hypothetical protein